MGIMSDQPQKEPMHYGEVFGIWSYLQVSKGMLAGYQTMINHSGDEDLRRFLEDLTENVIRPEIEQIEQILKVNGIGLPPSPPERPTANLEEIPVGARFNDPEIGTAVSRDLAAGLVTCSTMIGQSIREDIAAMFGQFHMTKSQYGLRMLRLMKEKGWLVTPPLHTNTPEPAHV
mgnify:CR=1 FL=1